MPHFHLHLRRREELILDEEGAELPDAEAAFLQAFESAQELWTMLLDKREDPAACSFEVVDHGGRLVFSLPLAEVLETTRKRARPVRALETAALISRAQGLRQSLVEQIETAQRTIGEARRLVNRMGKGRG
jgi:hypothetical protein